MKALSATALQRQLTGLRLGRDCRVYDEIDSTNAEAMRLAEAGAQEGLVVLAERQTAGRGRLGRSWHHLDHAGLAMSVLLRPRACPGNIAQLTLVAGVAVHAALAPHVPGLHLKWPNDLVWDGAKMGGILTEMRAEADVVHAVVIGIGINVHPPAGGWPAAIGQTACDLATSAGRDVSREHVAAAIIRSLDCAYGEYSRAGFAAFRDRWWQAHASSGRHVRVHDGRGYIDGIACGLDTDGALLLATDSGRQRIIAGEVESPSCL